MKNRGGESLLGLLSLPTCEKQSLSQRTHFDFWAGETNHVFKGTPYPCLPDALMWHCAILLCHFLQYRFLAFIFIFLEIYCVKVTLLSVTLFFFPSDRAQTKEIIPFKYRLVSQ